MAEPFYQTSEFSIKEQKFLSHHNLTKILPQDGFLIDKIPYASPNNFCNTQLYSHSFIYLHLATYEKLLIAQKYANQINLKLRLFDGYRPFAVQAFMADKFPHHVRSEYVSHPQDGVATHVRGIAIDLTLCDCDGIDLDMGSAFDEMSPISFHNFKQLSPEIINNRLTLLNIMEKAGFQAYPFEWWHYNLPIFKYDLNHNFIGTITQAQENYPKITDNFIDLLGKDVIEFYSLG